MKSRLVMIALLAPFSLASAQAGKNRALTREQRIEQRQQQQQMGQENPRRQQLEQQVRRNFWRVAKERIGFTDDQMAKLEQSSTRFDVRRKELNRQEKEQRVLLRGQLAADAQANATTVSGAMDRLQQLQRDRFELQAEEQKEFASFMTPVQRAKFTALQEQVRRRMQEIVRARPDSLP